MQHTYIHFTRPRDADLFEDFCSTKLEADEIFVPLHNQPINPEDEDDVVPDQHAAFGITRATQKPRESAWKDLGLAELMRKGPQPVGRDWALGGGGRGDLARVLGGKKTMPR